MLRILLFFAAALVFSGHALAEQTLRLMANSSPPYSDESLPQRGLALELVEHVFSRTPYTPQIVIESWSRALEGASIGVYDALAAAWYTPERDKAFLFSEPYLDSDMIIVKSRSTPGRYTSLQDLSGARLGILTDYAYGIEFNQVQGLQLVEENHLIQNLLNLLNGRVDFVIGDRRSVVFQLNEYLKDQIHKFEVVAIELPGRARHVAASREVDGHEAVIAAFNKALAETRRDGSYDAIIDKWEARYPALK